jgi:phosphatidylinositol glycan class B
MKKNDPLLTFTTIAAIVYLFMSYNSVGYYHPDEHYQILEFANYKLGKLDYEQLPWEYHYRIRSTFQPWIALAFIKVSNAIGVYNPYTITFLLRMLTALLSLCSIYRIVKVFSEYISPEFKILFLYLSWFLWFLPFINVRFSSETLSAIFFLLAVSYVLRPGKLGARSGYIVGLCCGLCFLCRFQSAFMIMGMLLWLIFVRKEAIRNLILIMLLCLSIVILGIIMDTVFYDAFTFSAWNYFRENILNDKASQFGIQPWNLYLSDIIRMLYFPCGIIILVSLIMYFVKFPKSLVTWSLVPLILVHFLVPHKEVRFLFPIVNFLPLILIKGMFEPMFGNTLRPKVVQILVMFIIIVNSVALTITLFSSPENGRIQITKYVYDHFKDEKLKIYYIGADNPFRPYPFIRQSFYEIAPVTFQQLQYFEQIDTAHITGDVNLLVLRRRHLHDGEIEDQLKSVEAEHLSSGKPSWCRYLLNMISYSPDGNDYVLYRIKSGVAHTRK